MGMEKIIQKHMNRKGADLDLLEQFQIYEAVLKHEDGETAAPILQNMDNLRYQYLCTYSTFIPTK